MGQAMVEGRELVGGIHTAENQRGCGDDGTCLDY
jgi:hypothetical protein